MNARWRRFALLTALGLAKRGYFIPYRYAGAVASQGAVAPFEALEAQFKAAEKVFAALIERMNGYRGALEAIGGDQPPQPRWRQDWFPRLDAAAAYTLVRALAPARIVEIGSGHSTRFMARAVADGGLSTRITAIDPAPRAVIEGLGVETVRATVQQADTAPFAALAAGDILFIDSSHILMPGSDVDLLLNRVLPALPAGVLVHIHDMLLPDPYPADWAWRGYNEQSAVAQLLLAGKRYKPVFASHYAATRMVRVVEASVAGGLPLPPGAMETSLWLEKQAD